MRWVFTIIFCISATVASADSSLDGLHWLKKVNEAMKSRNYHGTVVFMKNGQIDTMKYQHSVENGVEFERLTSLNSPLREVTRKSSEIKCLYKETSQKIETRHPLDRSFIVNLPPHPENLEDFYLLAATGQEMVAMRPTQIIAILPKDELRYARKLWADTQTGLPLKVEVYGLDGTALEQVLFTEMVLDAEPSPPDGPTQAGAEPNPQQVIEAHSFDSSPYQIKTWPPGFEKIFFIRNTMQQSKKTVDHLLISDGFSTVSVYFEAKGDKGIDGLRSLGPVNSYSRTIDDLQITVLGEVPVKTVEMLGQGVEIR